MTHNENSRVKIPAILHLMRLGFTYIPHTDHHFRDIKTNILPEIFKKKLQEINGNTFTKEDFKRLLEEIVLELDYEDLGESFYDRLVSKSGIKLIDFSNFDKNAFHVTTEMTYKNEDEEFRPDITLFINGLPLAFIEVKKPHNKEGILAERRRMNSRFKNKKFRRFANITQLMVFSNNMEYEEGVVDPVFGAFYAPSSYSDFNFNFFKEDIDFPVQQNLLSLNNEDENLILKDNNLMVIKHNPEFATNKHENTPTNRILTSLFSKERFAFMLQYGFAYVKDIDHQGKPSIQKHIMRYPQLFATQAIAKTLDEGKRKGIIWHTQGSGKTALAYFNVKHLTNYFQERGVVPKFYFVVDRLDLLTQAKTEFSNRGLKVNTVNSKQEFTNEFKKVKAIHNDSGIPEITVVNIQKFSEDSTISATSNYNLKIQRIFFVDEAHRSYNPKGSFLVNFLNSDKTAIKIALTGTPLLKAVAKDYSSTSIFGDYIHKYYYNQSIADGYTLRLIREEIEGNFKMQMEEILQQIEILKGDIKTSDAYAHINFVKPLLDYIVADLIQFRRDQRDATLGGMVVCDSSTQAKKLFAEFEKLYGDQEIDAGVLMAAEPPPQKYKRDEKPELKAALILHDENDKSIRRGLVDAFKKGRIDILFVYNMLLTGFDAHRLKKLYLARVIQDHNLLQTLTRVNRPYKKYKYGYVVDFADISKAFDRTNQLYYNELQNQLGDELKNYSNLFKSEEEIKNEAEEIKETLFHYDIKNLEVFSQQIEQINDKDELRRIIRALIQAKELKNTAILSEYGAWKDLLDFGKLNRALSDAQNRLGNLNLLEDLQNQDEIQNLLDEALEDVLFEFRKIGEEELKIADEYRDMLRKARESLQFNFDQKDPQFVSLKEELERIFKKKNLSEITQEGMREDMALLQKIYDQAKELNRKNELIQAKYKNDKKYARIHKRLQEKGELNAKEMQLYRALIQVKEEVDNELEGLEDLLDNEAYFKRFMHRIVIEKFKKKENIKLDYKTSENINQLLVNEYIQQYRTF